MIKYVIFILLICFVCIIIFTLLKVASDFDDEMEEFCDDFYDNDIEDKEYDYYENKYK